MYSQTPAKKAWTFMPLIFDKPAAFNIPEIAALTKS